MKSIISVSNDDSNIIFQNDGWAKISPLIESYFNRINSFNNNDNFDKHAIPKNEFISVYDTAYQMMVQKEPYNYSRFLYSKCGDVLKEYFRQKCIPALNAAKSQHALVFLQEMVKQWKYCKLAIAGISRMFMYLDRFHVPNNEDLESISIQGYTLFRFHVFEAFKDTLQESILQCILKERDGVVQDRDLLRDSVCIYVELEGELRHREPEIYKTDFHDSFIKETSQYYKQKSRTMINQLSCPEYLIQAEKWIENEIGRAQSYIDKFSENDLMLAIRKDILVKHQTELLGKATGIDKIFERTVAGDVESAKEDLVRLYALYKAVENGFVKISAAMRQHICKLGYQFIKKSKDNQQQNKTDHILIRDLIDLHDRFLKITKIQFMNENLFQLALKQAYEEFINKENYVSSLLARFVNDILRRGSKLAINDLENAMSHVVMLYGYLRDKDIFEREYQLYLATRLLEDLSQSEQNERTMIGKLKNEAGYLWTSKLEDMFKDIQLSKELMNEFNKTFASKYSIDLNVSVCTTGSWPTSSINGIKKPAALGQISDAFSQYYKGKYNGRKLTFQMNKGKADVQVIFKGKIKKTLVVSTYQMLILLLFNTKQTYTFKEMLDATGINKNDLSIAVLSMCHPKVKIMRKSPNSKNIEDNHKFQINPNYNNPRAKINIPTLHNIVGNKATINGPNVVPADIIRQRKYQMDAHIVRIMKTRQTLKHNDLMIQVVKQLQKRFEPKMLDIKKRIQCLIELEYLERDEQNRQIYKYKM